MLKCLRTAFPSGASSSTRTWNMIGARWKLPVASENGSVHRLYEVGRADRKAQRGLGHPAASRFLRMLSLGGATTAAIECAKHCWCPVCVVTKPPQHPSRTTTRTRLPSFQTVVCVDLTCLVDAEHNRRVLEQCTKCPTL